jgi:hypothetical protein
MRNKKKLTNVGLLDVDSPSPSGLGPNKVHCKEDEVTNRNSQINHNKKTQFKRVYEPLAMKM